MEDLYCTICAAPFSAKCLQASPTDIAGTVGNVSKCHKTAT